MFNECMAVGLGFPLVAMPSQPIQRFVYIIYENRTRRRHRQHSYRFPRAVSLPSRADCAPAANFSNIYNQKLKVVIIKIVSVMYLFDICVKGELSQKTQWIDGWMVDG